MVRKSKKAVALVLTAMMAAASLASCTPTETTVSNGGTTNSTPAPATSGSTENSSSGDTSTAQNSVDTSDAVDLLADEYITQVKDMIAAEAQANGGTVSLKVWASSDDNKFEKGLVKQFVNRYSDSRYTLKVSVSSLEEPDVASKLQADVSKGADVFSFPDDQIRTLVDTGCIARVSDTLYKKVVADNTDASVAACSIDGVPYAFPKTSDNGYFLYYDKRDLSEEDIQSFDSIIEKANAKGKSILYAMDNAWYNAGFFLAAGCTTSYDGKTQTTDFDSDKGFSAAKAMCHIAEKSNAGFTGTGANADVLAGFRNGTLSAAITGTWNGPGIKEAIGAENLGAAKLPTVLMDGEQKQLWSFGGYKCEGVRANTPYPNTAQMLAYYMTSKDSQLYRYGATGYTEYNDAEKSAVNSRGLIPTNKAALDTDDLKNDEAAKAIEAQRPYSTPQSNVGGKFWTPAGSFGGEILAKKGSISDDELKAKLTETVKGFNS